MKNLSFGTTFKDGSSIKESVTSEGKAWFTVCITQTVKGGGAIDRKSGLSSGYDENLTFTIGHTDKSVLLATQAEWLKECNEGLAFIYQERSYKPFNKKSELAINPSTGEQMNYYQRTVLSEPGMSWEEVQKLHKQFIDEPTNIVVATPEAVKEGAIF